MPRNLSSHSTQNKRWRFTTTTELPAGAEPDRLVAIIDDIANTDPTKAAEEQFIVVRKAGFAEVLRTVVFTR
jgi:hypothetical protein